jgi:hypothetical protein
MTKQGKRRLYNFIGIGLIIYALIPIVVFFTKIINDPKPLVANYRPGRILHKGNDSEEKDLFEVKEIESKPVPIKTNGTAIDANNAGNNKVRNTYTYSLKAFDEVNSDNASQQSVYMPSDFSTSAYQSKNKQVKQTEEVYASLPMPTISVRNFDQMNEVFASSPAYQHNINTEISSINKVAPPPPPDPGTEVPVQDGMWLLIGFGILYTIFKKSTILLKQIKQTFKY